MSGEAFVLHDADGFHVYRHVGATHAQRIGPVWKSPRQAIEYAKQLDLGYGVSPLRAPGEPTTDRSATPRVGRSSVVGSPGVPRGRQSVSPPTE